MKKIILLILVLFMLVGCGDGSSGEILMPPDYVIAVSSDLADSFAVVENCAVDSDQGFFEISVMADSEIALDAVDLALVSSWDGNQPAFELLLANDSARIIADKQPQGALLTVLDCLQRSAALDQLDSLVP